MKKANLEYFGVNLKVKICFFGPFFVFFFKFFESAKLENLNFEAHEKKKQRNKKLYHLSVLSIFSHFSA